MPTELLRAVLELLPNAFHRVGAAGDVLHASLGIGAGMRGLLLSLDRNGPTSVSKLAAMRPVSRQFVQRLVDDLLEQGWVKADPNPGHKRSPLIALTAKGRTAIATMLATEEPYLAILAAGMEANDLVAAARVLRIIIDRIGPDALTRLAGGIDLTMVKEAENA